MSDYSAPDPYRDGLAKLRTASGTPETRFEDTYRAMRAREYREESERRDLRFAQERGERT